MLQLILINLLFLTGNIQGVLDFMPEINFHISFRRMRLRLSGFIPRKEAI